MWKNLSPANIREFEGQDRSELSGAGAGFAERLSRFYVMTLAFTLSILCFRDVPVCIQRLF
jgi:hypothetical protein